MIELLNTGRQGGGGPPKESGEQITWGSAPTEPVRFGHGAVLVGDEMYLAGGFGESGTLVPNFHKYNFLTKQWANLANMNLATLRYSSLLFYNNDIRPLGLSNRKDAYAISGNVWRSLGSSPDWNVYGNVSAWWGGKLYVAGGDGLTVNGVTRTRQTFVEWNPVTDTWTILPNLPFISLYSIGGVIGDKLWITAGNGVNNGTPFIWFYDFITKVWTQGPSHPSGSVRAQMVGGVIDKRIIVGGGNDGAGHSKEVCAFDMDTMSWERLKDFDEPCTGGTAVVYDDKLWVYGGRTPTAISKFFSYDLKRR